MPLQYTKPESCEPIDAGHGALGDDFVVLIPDIVTLGCELQGMRFYEGGVHQLQIAGLIGQEVIRFIIDFEAVARIGVIVIEIKAFVTTPYIESAVVTWGIGYLLTNTAITGDIAADCSG